MLSCRLRHQIRLPQAITFRALGVRPMRIESDRLLFRPFTRDDVDNLHRLWMSPASEDIFGMMSQVLEREWYR